MSDVIKQVFSIQGQSIIFFGIIYLEDDIRPSAMLLARQSSQPGVLARKDHVSLDQLIAMVHEIATKLSLLYDSPMDVSPISDRVDVRGYAEMLSQMKLEWERQKQRRCALVNLN